jgi:SAM-dependent methyltransferase
MIQPSSPTAQQAGPTGPARVVDPYRYQLSQAEIDREMHREAVGGQWERIGRWQFDLLVELGLRPENRFLDVGCGALRGGVHFIRYLEKGHYYGIDLNESLLRAGRDVELPRAGLTGHDPHLLVDDSFEFGRFGVTFSCALAQSVFSHLTLNAIHRCLVRISEVLRPGARFYATYFDAPSRHALSPIEHPSGIVTYSDADPYHYHFSWFPWLVHDLPLQVRSLGTRNHPRSQNLLEFVHSG